MEDPLQRLDLNVTVLGYGSSGINALYSYHLDRHTPNPMPAKAKSQKVPELHPLYHFQFNSNKTHKLAEAKNLEFAHGPLFLDAPRIIHYPLDLVLALDFLMANYLPANWESLVSDGVYSNLCRQYQLAIWKPFIHALAKHWQMIKEPNSLQAKPLWPNLL